VESGPHDAAKVYARGQRILRWVIIVAVSLFTYLVIRGWAAIVYWVNHPTIRNDTSP
jgi:hypothetical protein